MDIYAYTAEHNPEGTCKLIYEMGYKPADSKDTVANAQYLRLLVQKYGKTAIDKIGDIHPDKELIIERYQIPKIEHKEEIKFSNCSGCNGNCSCNKKLNADGEATSVTAKTEEPKGSTHISISKETLALFAIFAIVGAIIINTNK